MSCSSPAPCEFLDWDSNFFHCRIGRVLGDTLDEAKAAAADEWSKSENIRVLYFLARSDHPDSVRCAEKNGFNLADVRLTLERSGKPDGNNPKLCTRRGIRQAEAQDIPYLQAIAAASHGDTRFSNDANFPKAIAEALYSTWIALEFQGRANAVFVATAGEDKPVGYISCHYNAASGAAQIGLMGVSEEARGNGLGGALVLSSLDWFAKAGATAVSVVTQGRNTAAQRLYQRCGFVTREVQLWFHKWYATFPKRDT